MKDASIIDWPVVFDRQFAKPLVEGYWFATTADRMNYLSNPRRYAGQEVYDYELHKKFRLSKDYTAWEEIAVGNGVRTITGPTVDNSDPDNIFLDAILHNDNAYADSDTVSNYAYVSKGNQEVEYLTLTNGSASISAGAGVDFLGGDFPLGQDHYWIWVKAPDGQFYVIHIVNNEVTNTTIKINSIRPLYDAIRYPFVDDFWTGADSTSKTVWDFASGEYRFYRKRNFSTGAMGISLGDNNMAARNGLSIGTFNGSENHGVSIGFSNITKGGYNVALGIYNLAQGIGAVSLGFNNRSTAIGAFASGNNNIASGLYSYSHGYRNTVKANDSAIIASQYCVIESSTHGDSVDVAVIGTKDVTVPTGVKQTTIVQKLWTGAGKVTNEVLKFWNDKGRSTINWPVTAPRTISLPDKDGTVALLSDITGGGGTGDSLPIGSEGQIVSYNSANTAYATNIWNIPYGNNPGTGVNFSNLQTGTVREISWSEEDDRMYFVGDGINPYLDLTKDGRILVESDLEGLGGGTTDAANIDYTPATPTWWELATGVTSMKVKQALDYVEANLINKVRDWFVAGAVFTDFYLTADFKQETIYSESYKTLRSVADVEGANSYVGDYTDIRINGSLKGSLGFYYFNGLTSPTFNLKSSRVDGSHTGMQLLFDADGYRLHDYKPVKTGIELYNFGEDFETGAGGDYSSLKDNSLVPKAWVKDYVGANGGTGTAVTAWTENNTATITIPSGVPIHKEYRKTDTSYTATVSGIQDGQELVYMVENTGASAISFGFGTTIKTEDGWVTSASISAGDVWEFVATYNPHISANLFVTGQLIKRSADK